MYKNYFKIGLFVVASALTLSACRKDRGTIIYPAEISGTKGIYVLNEGAFSNGSSNSTITYYNIETNATEADVYKTVNGTDLGKNANDLKAYGSKMYAVITGTGAANTSFIDVINIATGKSLKRISLNNSQPRYVAFANGKAYISNYSGKISKIDTTTMAVESELQLMNGAANATHLENLAVANGKLYIAGASYYGGANPYNNKLIVVNLTSFIKTKELTVTYNPQRLAVTESGELFLASWGDYFMVPAALQKINTTTDEVSQTQTKADLTILTANKNQVLAGVAPYGVAGSVNSIANATSSVGASYITDGTAISTPYGLTINPFDNNVVVSDANGFAAIGKAFVFGADGKKKHQFNTGTYPQAAVFRYSYK